MHRYPCTRHSPSHVSWEVYKMGRVPISLITLSVDANAVVRMNGELLSVLGSFFHPFVERKF